MHRDIDQVSAWEKARDTAGAFIGGLARRTIRWMRLGSGTSLPGQIAEIVSPGFVGRRAARCGHVIVVSGTNGKTTTASMLRAILDASGSRTIGNGSGANLRQGIATALLRIPSGTRFAVFEVDEAALAGLVPELAPDVLVVTNVFRDQLDRFGEIEHVVSLLRTACGSLPSGSTVIANADDPLLWSAIEDRTPVGFGIRLLERPVASPFGSEAEVCPRCGARLEYASRTIAHLGAALCRRCSWRSAPPEYLGVVIEREGLRSVTLDVAGERVTIPTGGVHNAYNAIAAIAAADLLGIPSKLSAEALRDFGPRFGRSEPVDVDGTPVWLTLMKNPGAADVLIREIVRDERIGAVIVSVNDASADGRDISWIWDVDFERLAQQGMPLFPSGRRAEDVAVRLKYAGGTVDQTRVDALEAIGAAVAACPAGRSPVVLATYTAMLDIRHAVGGRVASLADRRP